MALTYVDLNDDVRRLMLAEIKRDVAAGTLFFSPRLSPRGLEDYPQLLQDAVASGSDASLEAEINRLGRLNLTEEKRKPGGIGHTTARVPSNAAEIIGSGEFNRFYLRALCIIALDAGVSSLIIYRARPSAHPRPESEAKIDTPIDATQLLADLRNNIGVEPALGLPMVNSGLSARLP
ncbi:MAG TPA: hypothetical protein VME45_11630 [Stellaceae bacterium]|nr:hypothetical protein [Stellaceae bacterium]